MRNAYRIYTICHPFFPHFFRKYDIFFLVLVAYIFTYSFTSDNKDVLVAFEVAGPMIFLLVGLISGLEFAMTNQWYSASVGLILACAGLVNVYTYVYRDAPVRQLTARVESGIYKGLSTTPERKNLVETVEKELEKNILPSETVCAVTRVPMVYLMSKAKICAPQTWDAQFLARGYTDASPLLNYFQTIGETPDVLVATSLDISDFYHNEKYEINSFIDQKYELYYSSQIEEINVYLWRRK